MIVFAQCLLEKGVVVHRHHIARQHRLVIGNFCLGDKFDDEMKRMTRTARLVMGETYEALRNSPREIGADLLPPLVEASLIHWHDRVLTITGFERVPPNDIRPCSYRQSWMLRIPTPEEAHRILHGHPQQQADVPAQRSPSNAAVPGD